MSGRKSRGACRDRAKLESFPPEADAASTASGQPAVHAPSLAPAGVGVCESFPVVDVSDPNTGHHHRRRRPSGEPPPLPRELNRAAWLWLALFAFWAVIGSRL